ncbi:MAG: hypothetical protein O9289_07535 [Rhodobacteraceae bacterium]|nr:hypothetical protein [Paracoccaceae bacterium]MCZ8083044.1 hypothetical protein [Paracoccaceae bacterium]
MNVVDQTVTELSKLASRTVKHFNAFYGRNDDCWMFLENQNWLASILVTYSDRHINDMLQQLAPDSVELARDATFDARNEVASILAGRFAQGKTLS